MSLMDEPPGPWGPDQTDLFQMVWRGKSRWQPVYHMDPHCPLLPNRPLNSRLGSCLAAGMKLCERERNPLTWNLPQAMADMKQEGRRRALQALGVHHA